MKSNWPCTCGFSGASLSTTKRHKLKCEEWAQRDKTALQRQRLTSTFVGKFGVDNPMKSKIVKDKVADIFTTKYGGHVLSKQSSLFARVQKNNLQTKLTNAYWKKRQQPRSIAEHKDFRIHDITIRLSSIREVRPFLDQYHYARTGRNSVAVLAFFLQDIQVGVVKLATCVRQAVASSSGFKDSETLELDRLCIHPEYQKRNFASWMISKTVTYVRRNLPNIKCLISFADTAQGHSGVIYQASNWERLSETRDSYLYCDKDGNELNKKGVYSTARKLGLKEKEYVNQMGLIRIDLPHKIKYRYIIRRSKWFANTVG